MAKSLAIFCLISAVIVHRTVADIAGVAGQDFSDEESDEDSDESEDASDEYDDPSFNPEIEMASVSRLVRVIRVARSSGSFSVRFQTYPSDTPSTLASPNIFNPLNHLQFFFTKSD